MTETTIRLHITPLTPELLPSVLPPSMRSSATDISFHSLPTFPENDYGYITLPTMEAEKIKKKLNGSILKGKKFKIETARPSKRQRHEEAEEVPAEKEKKKSKKRKSEDADSSVLEGYELPSDRKVKRAWTEPSGSRRKSDKKSKDDKKEKPQPKSKYTDKSELLFRTTLPPNRASEEAADDKKAKKKKKSSRETVVHEFEKTYTHPSFLRTAGEEVKPSTTFDEEKGWVDASGDVKEAPSKKSRKENYRPGKVAGAKEKRLSKKALGVKEKSKSPVPSSESDDWTSSSGSSLESSDSESESESDAESNSDKSSKEVVIKEAPKELASLKKTTTPIKGISSAAEDSESKSESGSDSSSNSDSDSDSEPTNTKEVAAEGPASNEVHPLEALFKRNTQGASRDQPGEDTNTGFSFFGNGDIESDDETKSAEPQTPFTPFTKRDLQDRGLRSAAPTPDTAMINKRMNWTEEDEDDSEDDMSINTPVSKARGADELKEETEFTKWFWENRGDNNRAWKKRRRDAAKEQRQRENRKKAREAGRTGCSSKSTLLSGNSRQQTVETELPSQHSRNLIQDLFAAPTSFCKCTCFSNSTIIPLDPAKSGSDPLSNVMNLYSRAVDNTLDTAEANSETESDPESAIPDEREEGDLDLSKRAKKYRQLSCNDCNRKFCLDYELPTCKGAKEDDVFTTCFQRDSRKDEAVVFIFIFATGGLLAWAVCKPWVERYLEAARERRSYMPVEES
ncbi:hypothetical protein N7532_011037 [Penicillium argentinense]|uniref:Uncharacterized protein n=1 Tax=Penicillium argentinense TaxID=1131581 RepID=A0A9W9EHN7_9EURO|nr:uncharacterized protein N7532_011037 [Penicillium argentinense]KAJ5081994.1 hypothetical protein N7532_011037 [Penicillium argentinense]